MNETTKEIQKTRVDSTRDSIPIKVINPLRKRESKTYMLNLHIGTTTTLKHLREEMLEQLGKDVVSFDLQFDVGYFVASSRKICFVDTDNIQTELTRLRNNGKSLWCEGNRGKAVCVVDDDYEDEDVPMAKKSKVHKKLNSQEAKAKRVDELAVELQGMHKEKCNKIQYKLWAEAIDSGKHKSKSYPPAGTIWNTDKVKPKTVEPVDAMATAFTKMADKVASAFNHSEKELSHSADHKEHTPGTNTCNSVGISPGRRIDYQEKLLNQIDLAHKMFECGAITTEQFEKRRNLLLTQLDVLGQ